MAKVTLQTVGSLANPLSAQQRLDANSAAIETGFENTLSRDGTTPNQMAADIDLNSYSLLNVDQLLANDMQANNLLLDRLQLREVVAANVPIPPAGMVFVFVDSATGEPSYKDDTNSYYSLVGTEGSPGSPGSNGAPGSPGADGVGVPAGGTAGQVLEKINATNYNTQWATPAAGGGIWGSITGTLSTQADLQSALDGKAATGHNHDASYAPLAHVGASGTAHLNAEADGPAGFMTGADKTKLDGVATAATANSSDATLLARDNHTGTQLASTISDFSDATAATASVTANTEKVTNATHTGDATGATALTIATGVVSNAKLATVAANSIKGNNTGSTAAPIDMTVAQARTLLTISNVDNTSDANKPVSTAQASANTDDRARANHTGTQAHTTVTMEVAGLLGRSIDSAGAVEEITLGTNLSFTGTTLNAEGGGGGGGMAWTTIVNANVSPAVTSTGYIMETGGTQRTITLPASVPAGFTLSVNANAGEVKIISNGNVIDPVGSGNDLVLADGNTVSLVGKATGQLELVYGGVGTAGGSTTQIQYNNAGAISGSPDFLWNNTAKALTLGAVSAEPAAPAEGMLTYYAKEIAGRIVPKVKGPAGLDYPLQATVWQNNTTLWTPTTATAGFWQGTAGSGAGTYSTALPTTTNLYTSMKRARWANVVTTLNQVLGQRNTEAMYMRGSVAGQGGFFFFARCGTDVWTDGARFFAGLHTATTVISADPSALNNTVGFCVDAADNGAISFLTRGTAATKATTGMTLATNVGFDLYMFCAPNDTKVGWRIVNINTGEEVSGVATDTLPSNTVLVRAGVLASNAALTPVTSVQLGVNRIYIETDI